MLTFLPQNTEFQPFCEFQGGYDVRERSKICIFTLRCINITYLYNIRYQIMHQLSFIQFLGSNICSLICVKTRTLSCLASPYGDADIQEARGQILTLFQLKLVKTLFLHCFQCNQAKNFKNKKSGIYGLTHDPQEAKKACANANRALKGTFYYS